MAVDARELLEHAVFYDPQPSPRADLEAMFSIGFRHDGAVAFGAGSDNPVQLADRLRRLLAVLVAHPEILEEACGIRGSAFHILGVPLVRGPEDA